MAAKTLAQKRKRNVILMIVVLLLALAAFIGLTIYNNHRDDAAKGTRITKARPQEIKSFTLYRADLDQTAEMVIDENGVWSSTTYPDANLMQGYVKYMLNSLTEVRLSKKVPDTDLATYGLDHPNIVISAQTDKETIRLNVGDANAAGVGYYVTFGTSNDIYLMGSEYYEGISYTFGQLNEPDPIQELTVNSLVRVKRVQGEELIELNYDAESGSFLHMRMDEPYHGQVYANKVALTSFIDVYNLLAFDACYDYDCEDYTKYGFDDPAMTLEVTFRTTDEEILDYTLEFGAQNEDNQYYVRSSLSNNINLLNGTNATTFLNFKPYNYVYKTIYYGVGKDLEEIVVEANGKSVSIDPEKDVDLYESVGSLVRLIAIDAEASDSQKIGDEVCKITVYLSGKESVWTFYDYDGQSLYLLDLNGKDRSFVVKKADLDEIIRTAGLE